MNSCCHIAKMQVPDFWPADEEGINNHIAVVPPDRLLRYGTSAGGRDLHLIRHPNPGKPRLWVIGGTHGHEPGGPAACFNLLHILRHGEDLRQKQWPDIVGLATGLDITVVPLLNPDGRARCPDSLVGWPTGGLDGIAQSWRREDRSVPTVEEAIPNGLDPEEMLFLGGRFNDDGFLANRPVSVEKTLFVEFQQLLDYMAQNEPPQCYLDLHACGSNFFCMNGGFTEPYREKLRAINRATAEAIKSLGHQYNEKMYGDPTPPGPGIVGNVRMLYVRWGTLAFPYEGRQGFLDILPWCDESDILDDYLIAIRETMRLGVAEGYIPDE